MGDKINSITIGELFAIIAGVMALFYFGKLIIAPLIGKWLKIDKNTTDVEQLKKLPERVTLLENYKENDYKAIKSIQEVNVLLIEAMLALLDAQGNNAEVDGVKKKLQGFLIGKVGG